MSSTLYKLTVSARAPTQLLALLVGVAYGALLANLPMDNAIDRVNYLNYIRDSWVLFLQNWSAGWLPFLMNEPLWLLLNAFLSMFLTPEEGVQAIIACSAGAVAWVVTRRQAHSPATIPLILLFPKLIFYYIVALRNGVALALFVCGWFSSRPVLRWLLLALVPFVHVSYFIVLALLALAWLTRQMRLAANLRLLVFALVSLAFASGASILATMLRVRQASEYIFAPSEFSGLGILFWTSILCLMWLEGREFLRQHVFETGSIVFYIVTVWLVEVAARAFESTSLVVLLAGMHLTGWRRVVFIALITAYLLVHVMLNRDKPLLGFGVG